MVGNHSRRIFFPWWSFLCSFSDFWNCDVAYHIQMKYSHQCVSLGWDVLHIWHRPVCITDLYCLSPWSSYHQLCVLGIATLASVQPCPPRRSWPLWCIRNNIAVSMSNLPSFAIQSISSAIEFRMHTSLFYSIVEISQMFYKPFFVSDDTIMLSLSTNKEIDSSI